MTNTEDPTLVVVQLSGGNDYLNTIVPYTDGAYYDSRPNVHIRPDDVIPLDDALGFAPSAAPMKRFWDEGSMAIIHGIGYPNPNRSHFRSMDIWHTAVPETIGRDGWLGRAIREMDPSGDNVLTGVNFGRGLPRVLQCEGVPVASVGSLESYGLFPDIQEEVSRARALEAFGKLYGSVDARDSLAGFLAQTGNDALRGADVLSSAARSYKSSVEYSGSPIAQSLRDVAQVMFGDLGARVLYTVQGGYDTHFKEMETHARLWSELSAALTDFMDDLAEHGRAESTLVLVFSEFGRRIDDNGTGTDHGSGGVAFCLGQPVNGGHYGEYPSLKESDRLEGDLHYNNDFRGVYSTILDRWLGVDPAAVLDGAFEQLDLVRR